MAITTQGVEKETFNKVLEEAARLAVEHKLAGLPIELRPGELEKIYRKYADITDVPLFERFMGYTKSPEGRDFFRKTIRLELWEAGYRPKGWEESHSTEERPLEFLNGYAVPLRERAPIEDRTRNLLLAEINSEWKTTRQLLKAIEEKRRVYIDMEWALHILLDKILKEGKVGQATFWGSVSSWWNNQPLACPECTTWEVDQFYTEGGILIHNHCINCHRWGGLEKK